ncbi:MAG: vWA domain-containing protein [bacterium]|nr:VWA domain-containing protein [bacterium]MDT8366659.1 vWA domain-containing protein [bacterium]
MTSLLLVLGLLMIPIAVKAARQDSYHVPAITAVIVTFRTLTILLLFILVTIWPQTRPLESTGIPRAVILIDGQSAGPVHLQSTIEKKLPYFQDAGYDPLILFYNNAQASSLHLKLPGYHLEYFGDIERALLRVSWEMGKDDRVIAAVLSEEYPGILNEPPWYGEKITWIKTLRAFSPSIRTVKAPRRVFIGQTFTGSFQLSPKTAPGDLSLTLDKQSGDIELDEAQAGSHTRSFSMAIEEPGHHTLRLKVTGADGSVQEENHHSILAIKRPRIHYISPSGVTTPMARTFLEAGFSVEPISPLRLMSHDRSQLEGFDTGDIIVLDAIPQEYMTTKAVEFLDQTVFTGGQDLLFITGENVDRSASGSYLEDLLPVKFGSENRNEEEQSLAMVAIVDASLSMFYKIGGGGGWGHSASGTGGWGMKIKMAKKSLLNLSEALPDTAPFGVLTVTNNPSWVFEPTLPRDRANEEELIGRIKAYGPGINLYSGLLEAYEKLRQIRSDAKHILVFLDTADVDEYQVDEVGTVWDLLKKFNEESITVSLIGFGKRGDEHISQLNRFADESGGYFYLTTDINQIPGFSLQDLDQISDNLISYKFRKPTFFRHDFPNIENLPDIRGQAITTLKPGASVLAWTETGFPLLARWRYGAGTITVFTGDNGLALARDWYGKDSPWEALLAQIGVRREMESSTFLTRITGSKRLFYRPPGGKTGSSYAKAFFQGGISSDFDLEEVAPGAYTTSPLDLDKIPLSMDVFSPETSLSQINKALTLDFKSAQRTMTVVEPPEFNIPIVEPLPQQKVPDNSILRLLILLVVFLVTIDELFRPPNMEAGQ